MKKGLNSNNISSGSGALGCDQCLDHFIMELWESGCYNTPVVQWVAIRVVRIETAIHSRQYSSSGAQDGFGPTSVPPLRTGRWKYVSMGFPFQKQKDLKNESIHVQQFIFLVILRAYGFFYFKKRQE